jgi:thiol-disulfide isomerase/thioredoxin
MKAIKAVIVFGSMLFAASAFALEIKPYSADTFAQIQKSGAGVALHFHADWCPTCRAQEKVFNGWKGDASVPGNLLVVDYDKERDLKNKLNVRTQSTLIVFKGDKEVARLAGKSDEKSLKEALLK